MMSYLRLSQGILDQVRSAGGQVLSLDMETKVIDGAFLAGETVLGFSAAWREEGTIKTHVSVLSDETRDSEWMVLEDLDQLMIHLKPLVIVGYYVTEYDIPLLH